MFAMPWIYLHSLRGDDATAIARYLKSLPAVHNHIPAPLRFGVLETILAKIGRPLPAVQTTNLTFADQQFGQTQGWSREWPQTWLIDAQWIVLLIGVVGYVFAARRAHLKRSTLRTVGGIAGLILLVALVYVLYELPLLSVIPPD